MHKLKMFHDESGKTSPAKVIATSIFVVIIPILICAALIMGKDVHSFTLSAMGILAGTGGTLLGVGQWRSASVHNKRTESMAKTKTPEIKP